MKRHEFFGKLFGYPSCCIEDFCSSTIDEIRSRHGAGKQTGFVPCRKHARMIREGKMEPQDLIMNRYHKQPFPFTNETQALKAWNDYLYNEKTPWNQESTQKTH